jgi:Protein of unknown function (DUF1566)
LICRIGDVGLRLARYTSFKVSEPRQQDALAGDFAPACGACVFNEQGKSLMKRSLLVVGLVLFTSLAVSAAAVLKVTYAQALGGQAVVIGKATPGAAIYWEGTRVTTAVDKGFLAGYFAFSGVMPWDCTGTLTDGVESVKVVVKTSHPDSDCRAPAPVAQTGQKTSFTPHDDGDERAGVTQPTPRFTDNADGTITDNLTGLTWLKNANCPGAPAASEQSAIAAVATLNATGVMNAVDCGDTSNNNTHQTDWRLPNIKELESLINYGFVNPAFSGASGLTNGTAQDPFSNFQVAAGYWSSTTYSGDSSIAWGISFSNPTTIVNNGAKSFSGYVLAVRGGKTF